MFDFLKQPHHALDIFRPHADHGILCPKCEKPLEGHDEGNCKRKMSRRFFMGAATGLVVAAAIPAAVSKSRSGLTFDRLSPQIGRLVDDARIEAGNIPAGRDIIEIPVVEAPPPEAWFPGARFGMFEHGAQRFVAEFRQDGKDTYGTHYGLPLKDEVSKLRTEGYRVLLSDSYEKLTAEMKRMDSRHAFGMSSLYVPHF
jgi:hypothetical protein